MNIERLEIIAEWLEAGAPHMDGCGFNMGVWHSGGYPDYKGKSCGTAMCIGGATEQFFGSPHDDSRCIHEQIIVGSNLLGLTYEKAEKLFHPEAGCLGLYRYSDIGPDLAAKVIRNLIKTGEVNWGLNYN